jgi:hypothetical protein
LGFTGLVSESEVTASTEVFGKEGMFCRYGDVRDFGFRMELIGAETAVTDLAGTVFAIEFA